jgi:DNA mismatch endonuclease, patch repair protein
VRPIPSRLAWLPCSFGRAAAGDGSVRGSRYTELTDTLSPVERSERMRRVRYIDTKPELRVRSAVHVLGYRYRLHERDLPGVPDLVFRSRRKVILVHGCFWHRHRCKMGRRSPKSRLAFWGPKLARNAERDRINRRDLRHQGWQVLVIWECKTKNTDELRRMIVAFLGR